MSPRLERLLKEYAEEKRLWKRAVWQQRCSPDEEVWRKASKNEDYYWDRMVNAGNRVASALLAEQRKRGKQL